MKKLGELLTEHGWVKRPDLMRALHHQRQVGGRLGTCLLEMGLVREDHLVEALARQHRAEVVPVEDLRQVPEDLRDLVPARIAVRCRAVPVHATTSKLTVAMMDPGDLACQDELAFATGRRLVIGVASEVRIREALERYYGEACDSRFTQILDHLNRRRYLWSQEGDRDRSADGGEEPARPLFPTSPDLAPPPLPRPHFDKPGEGAAAAAQRTDPAAGTAAPRPRSRPHSVTLSEEERHALYGGRAPAPLTYREAHERLDEIGSRDVAARLVVDFLRQEFERVLLFAVRKDETTGWMGDAEGLEEEELEAIRIPFSRPSLFLNLRQGGAFYLGPLPSMPAHRPLVELLGGEAPEEILLLPVRLGDRLAAVVWCDRGGPLGAVDLESLRDLADALADTLQRCILLKRQAQT